MGWRYNRPKIRLCDPAAEGIENGKRKMAALRHKDEILLPQQARRTRTLPRSANADGPQEILLNNLLLCLKRFLTIAWAICGEKPGEKHIFYISYPNLQRIGALTDGGNGATFVVERRTNVPGTEIKKRWRQTT